VWFRNRATYRNTNLILETLINVLHPLQIWSLQLGELDRIKLPITEKGSIYTLKISGFQIEQHIGKLKQAYILPEFGIVRSPNSEN